MSEPESTPPVPEAPQPDAPEPASLANALRPSRLRRFFLRHLPRTTAGLAILLAVAVTALYFLASSASFENFVRERMVHKLEMATGGRVEIRAFHWKLLKGEAEADGLVIHGLEGPGAAPYAQVERLRVRLSVLGFLSPRILLRDLEIYAEKAGEPFTRQVLRSRNQPHLGRAGPSGVREPRLGLRLPGSIHSARFWRRRSFPAHGACTGKGRKSGVLSH
jgi:hypothetical protein